MDRRWVTQRGLQFARTEGLFLFARDYARHSFTISCSAIGEFSRQHHGPARKPAPEAAGHTLPRERGAWTQGR